MRTLTSLEAIVTDLMGLKRFFSAIFYEHNKISSPNNYVNALKLLIYGYIFIYTRLVEYFHFVVIFIDDYRGMENFLLFSPKEGRKKNSSEEKIQYEKKIML